MKNNFPKILIFVSLVVFIFSCFIFVFLYRAVNQNNQKAESGAVAWQTETERRSEINSLNSALGQVSDDRVLLQSHFIPSSDVVPFLNTIEQLGPSAGATPQITSVDTGKNNTQLIVSLSAKGSFQQIYKFLTLLENSPYELEFLSMNMHESASSDIAQSEATTGTSIQSSKVSSKSAKSLPEWDGDFQIQLLSFTP